VTYGFDESPKVPLTVWLGFWLGHLCDVDHMESRGVCGAVLRCAVSRASIQAPRRDLTRTLRVPKTYATR